MKIVHLIPGSGDTFYCENCLRDAGLLRALRAHGHDPVAVPMYLPLMIDRPEDLPGGAVFFGGVNVYLQQKLGLFRHTPRWLDRLFDSPRLLRWAARRAGMTSAKDLGRTTLSMLRGEHGRQRKELDRLVEHLRAEGAPDVVFLSNCLLVGLARRIRQDLGSAVVCALQDEDGFLDGIVEPYRRQAWEELSARAGDVDTFIAVSDYYSEVMKRRLGLEAGRVRVVHSGVVPEEYEPAAGRPEPPAVGFLSRLCPEKGVEVLVEAFILLKADDRFGEVKLRLAGGATAEDAPVLDRVRGRLASSGVAGDTAFLPHLDAAGRRDFLRSLAVLSVPAPRGEAFGMYILEALACGIPVVQPAAGAFVELVRATGGGLLCAPDDPRDLAEKLGRLLADASLAGALGAAGRKAVVEHFNVERMAREVADVCRDVAPARAGHG